jgi:D-glycero-D-manno-heptose 1,7-bisphosphate phosphatase
LIDLSRSVLIGDAESDVQAGLAAGVGTRVLVGTGHGSVDAATHRVGRVQDVLDVVSRTMRPVPRPRIIA